MMKDVIISAVLELVAGIGIFLIACNMLSSNLEAASSSKLRKLFYKANKSKLLGVGIGTVATAVIQSSGATAVMTMGFLNAKVMELKQAVSIIMGAAIGTTVTGQIVALGLSSGGGVSTTIIFSSFAGLGALLVSFAKKDNLKIAGGVISSFGMLFVGLNIMSSSMGQFARMESVELFIAGISNPLFLVLVGIIITAIVQSSSVTTSVAIAMLVSGLINLNQGIYLALGANIGSCSVGMIASMSSKASSNSKRVALAQLTFKTLGVILFIIIDALMRGFSHQTVSLASIIYRMFPNAAQAQLAMFHTFFNVIIVALALPLSDLLTKFVTYLVEDDSKKKKDELHLYYLDENMLMTPAIAARQVKNEIVNMGKIALENFNRSLDIVCKQDFKELKKFQKREQELDFLNGAITKYVIELQKRTSNDYDIRYLATTFRSVADFERIGDYAENITEYAEVLKNTNEKFSEKAIEEIKHVGQLVNNMSSFIFKAYYDKDMTAFNNADFIEDQVDDYTDMMAQNHITRLNEGLCSSSVGAQYLSLAENVERIADHLINVGKSITTLYN